MKDRLSEGENSKIFHLVPQNKDDYDTVVDTLGKGLPLDECYKENKAFLSGGDLIRTEVLTDVLSRREDAQELSAFITNMCKQGMETFVNSTREVLCQTEGGKSLIFSRREICQIMALVACGIDVVVPPKRKKTIPRMTFKIIFANHAEKTEFILSYFEFMRHAIESRGDEKLEISRIRIPLTPTAEQASFWKNSTKPMLKFIVDEDGTIEDKMGMLQADFANEYLGGGALTWGVAQEELRFMITPECNAFMPMTEAMLPDEALLIKGPIQVSKYSGYGHSAKYDGPFTDPAALDENGYRDVEIIAFDALCNPGKRQYSTEGVHRELWKAFVAFSAGSKTHIATGNWGSGAFGGDPRLKSLIQWIAASENSREVVYHVYGDNRVSDLKKVIERAFEKNPDLTVGDMYYHVISDPAHAYEKLL